MKCELYSLSQLKEWPRTFQHPFCKYDKNVDNSSRNIRKQFISKLLKTAEDIQRNLSSFKTTIDKIPNMLEMFLKMVSLKKM